MSGTLLADTVTLFRREALRYRRDRAYWIGQLAFPLGVVGVIGNGLERVVSLPTGAGYEAHLASGMIALVVGSGVTTDTARGLLDVADALIVGSSIKKHGVWSNPVDSNRATDFVKAAR